MQTNENRHEKQEVGDAILDHLYKKIPNAVIDKQLYSVLNYSKDQIDEAIAELKTDGKITSNRGDSNVDAVFQDIKTIRTAYYLKEYPKNYPFKESVVIGKTSVPRLLDGDTMRGEDVNQITDSLKEYTDNMQTELNMRVSQEVGRIYRQIIGIFGIFVSVFALIVISGDKLITLDPRLISSDGFWAVIWRSSAMFIPVFILLLTFLSLLWLITRTRP